MANMYRVKTNWVGEGITGPAVTTMMFLEAGGSAQQAANAVKAFWVALTGYINDATLWTVDPEVDVVDIDTGLNIGLAAVTLTAAFPSDTGEALPWQTQGLVRYRTGIYTNGVELRGRTFVPGATQTFNNSGKPETTYSAALKSAGDALVADATSVFGIYSRVHNLFASPALVTGWDRWATLRSRRD